MQEYVLEGVDTVSGMTDDARRCLFAFDPLGDALWLHYKTGTMETLGWSATVVAAVVRWLRFAHLCVMDADTPGSWLCGVVRHWTRTPERAIDLLRDEGRCRQLFGDDSLATAHVMDIASQVLPWWDWHVSGQRDAAFQGIVQWFREGWWRDSLIPPLCRFRFLKGVTPVWPSALPRRFPVDLARLVLEVGDIGEALFFGPLLDAPFYPGEWRWTERTTVDADLPHEDVFAGGLEVGIGGGGIYSTFVMPLTGACRGQVWLHDDVEYSDSEFSTLERFHHCSDVCSDVMVMVAYAIVTTTRSNHGARGLPECVRWRRA